MIIWIIIGKFSDPAPAMIIDTDGCPRFICTRCGVKYKTMSRLKGHLKECGKGAKCEICGFVVTQRRNLAAHMAKHTASSIKSIRKMKQVQWWGIE